MAEREGLFRRRRSEGARGKRVVIKHDEAEYERVSTMASRLEISIPRLYEQSLFAGDTVAAQRLTTLLMELRLALRLMGNGANNLNQLAMKANAGGDIHWPQIEASAQLMLAQVSELKELIARIPAARAFDVEDL